MQQNLDFTDDELLNLSDDEIRERCQVFSFSRKKYDECLNAPSEWQQIVQAHLYFEHVVTQILLEAMDSPEEIQLSRMAHSQKISLARAFNLIPLEVTPCVKKVTELRNRVAHDLSFSFTDKERLDLENATPKVMRNAILAEKGRSPGPLKFAELLLVILLQLELVRQGNFASRVLARKHSLRLRLALDNYRKVSLDN